MTDQAQPPSPASDAPLIVDPVRFAFWEQNPPATGIYVRAKMKKNDAAWGNYDIGVLERESLLRWLKSRGGSNEWAENTVLIILGYE